MIQLDRDYGGGALRFFTGDIFRISIGAEYERMAERRKGFVNNNGVQGELRRDEDDTVSSTDFYAQAEWRFAPRWNATGISSSKPVRPRACSGRSTSGNPTSSS